MRRARQLGLQRHPVTAQRGELMSMCSIKTSIFSLVLRRRSRGSAISLLAPNIGSETVTLMRRLATLTPNLRVHAANAALRPWKAASMFRMLPESTASCNSPRPWRNSAASRVWRTSVIARPTLHPSRCAVCSTYLPRSGTFSPRSWLRSQRAFRLRYSAVTSASNKSRIALPVLVRGGSTSKPQISGSRG